MHKSTNFANNGAREMKLGSFGGGDNCEHGGIVQLVISSMVAMQDDFLEGKILRGRV